MRRGDEPASCSSSGTISLTGGTPPEVTTRGATVDWTPTISDDLYAFLEGGVNYTDTDRGNTYNFGLGGHYLLSPTLSLGMRYDFIYRTARPYTGGYLQNAVTVSLNKDF